MYKKPEFKNTFVFQREWGKLFYSLEPELQAELLYILIEWNPETKMPEVDNLVLQIALNFICPKIQETDTAYYERLEKNREAGRKGGLKTQEHKRELNKHLEQSEAGSSDASNSLNDNSETCEDDNNFSDN
jgi:hypothetical protein